MREAEKFRTERLVARPWQIEDLPLAMELWGDPAVAALIDSRGRLTNAQVGEKLRAEIERERSGGVQYWALFDHRNGEFVGCGGLRPWLYTPGEANFEVGFHLVKRCWRHGAGCSTAPIAPPTALTRGIAATSAFRSAAGVRLMLCGVMRPHTLPSCRSRIISPSTRSVLTRSKNDQRPDHPSLCQIRFWPSQPRGGEGPEVALSNRLM